MTRSIDECGNYFNIDLTQSRYEFYLTICIWKTASIDKIVQIYMYKNSILIKSTNKVKHKRFFLYSTYLYILGGELMRQLLQLMYLRTDPWAPTSNPIPFVELKDCCKKVSDKPLLTQYLDQYLKVMGMQHFVMSY